jgi:hypothetical protein
MIQQQNTAEQRVAVLSNSLIMFPISVLIQQIQQIQQFPHWRALMVPTASYFLLYLLYFYKERRKKLLKTKGFWQYSKQVSLLYFSTFCCILLYWSSPACVLGFERGNNT